VDVSGGTCVKFNEIEDQSRRVASALTRRGFKKGDLLYFVTYEMAQLYVIKFAVWRLGGTVRGWVTQERMGKQFFFFFKKR
jgi:acyl-coenzyme A synthetase/AMP-(fatty) acid ligase